METTGLSPTQLAYLAGLIDGEGSLECQKQMQRHGRTPRYSLRLCFVMATTEPLQTVAGWLGLTIRRYPPVDELRGWRNRLDIPKGLAVLVLQECLPFLLLKGRQAELILGIEATRAAGSPAWCGNGMPAETVAAMETLHLELRSLKSNKRPVSCR